MQSYIRSLEARLKSVNTVCERVDLLNALAWELQQIDTPRMALLCEQAFQLAQIEQYHRGTAESQVNLARVHYVCSEYEPALKLAQQALETYDGDDFTRARIHAFNTIGSTYRQLGDTTIALEIHQKELALAQQIKDTRLEASALSGIGSIYGTIGNVQTALTYYEQALALAQAGEDTNAAAAILFNMSFTRRMANDYPGAQLYLNQSLQLAEGSENIYLQILLAQNLAFMLRQAKAYDEALPHVENSLRLSRQFNYPKWEATALIEIGEIYTRKKQYSQGLEYIRHGLDLATKLSDKLPMSVGYQALVTVYKQMGQTDLALENLERCAELQEELRSQENEQKFKQLELRFHTQQARQEAELHRKLREQDREYFERLSQMKDDFMRTASHDLKNPLSSIALVTDLLERHGTTRDKKGKEYIQRIQNEIDRMHSLITGLLDLARLETGRGLERQTASLTQIIQEMVYAYELVAHSRKIELNFIAPPDRYETQFDPQQMRQVLANLISNAIKYTTSPGQVEITVTASKNTLTITVKDNGIGIHAEDLPHVFERFYRVKREQGYEQEGTGLGLAIAKSIVEQHGGKIWVLSEPQQGSTFCFSLPYEQSAAVM